MSAAFGMQLRLTARPGRLEELVAALTAVDESLAGEEACLLHVVGTVPDADGVAVIAEAWTDPAAHARWREAPATAPLIARVRAAATGPPDVLEVAWRGGKGLPAL
jgi:quinol monooxygenase YgiN